MTRNPRQILDDLVDYARHFLMHEERLLDPVSPDNPFPIDERVFLIEQGYAGAAYGLFRTFEEYKSRVAELPPNPFNYALQDAIEAIPGLIESRLRRWGWDLSVLRPEGFARLCERCKAEQEARQRAVDEAAVSWRKLGRMLGKNLTKHLGADRVAFAAEQRGVTPKMTPEEGERAYHRAVESLWMKPMIGHAVPEVTLDEHEQLWRAVNELDRLARQEWLPSAVILGNPYSTDAETVCLSELERAECQQIVEQPRDEASPSTFTERSGNRAEPTEPARWLTVTEAATVAGTSKGTISRAVDEGDLKSNGAKRHARRIDAVDLAQWTLKRSNLSVPTETDEQVERRMRNARSK